MLFGKYSMSNMIKEFQENKPLIQAYLKNKSIEGVDDDSSKVMGMKVAAFLVLLLVSMVVWIWALVSLFKYWVILPDWAKVVGLLSLLGVLGGPVVTLIVVYISKPKSMFRY